MFLFSRLLWLVGLLRPDAVAKLQRLAQKGFSAMLQRFSIRLQDAKRPYLVDKNGHVRNEHE